MLEPPDGFFDDFDGDADGWQKEPPTETHPQGDQEGDGDHVARDAGKVKDMDVNDMFRLGLIESVDDIPTEPMIIEGAIRKAGDLLPDASAMIQRRRDGIDKPIPLAHPERSESLSGGYWAPGLHVLIGGTGTGKSTLALQDALEAARAGVPVLYVGIELDEPQIMTRLTALEAKVPWSKVYRGLASDEQMRLFDEAGERIKQMPLYVDVARPGGWPVSRLGQVIGQVRRIHREGPILVIVDYLQIVSPEEKDRDELRERIGKISYEGRALAIEHNAAIVFVSSTARANYGVFAGRQFKTLGLGIVGAKEHQDGRKVIAAPDLLVGTGKESGELEFAADTVTALVRWPARLDGDAVVLAVVAKNRIGPTAWSAMVLDHGTRFVAFEVHEMDDLPDPKTETSTSDQEYRERILEAIRENSPTGKKTDIIKWSHSKAEKASQAFGSLVDDEIIGKVDGAWVIL